jgi:hypothetical protein
VGSAVTRRQELSHKQRVLTARYRTTCGRCNQSIEVGATITGRGRKYEHMVCPSTLPIIPKGVVTEKKPRPAQQVVTGLIGDCLFCPEPITKVHLALQLKTGIAHATCVGLNGR